MQDMVFAYYALSPAQLAVKGLGAHQWNEPIRIGHSPSNSTNGISMPEACKRLFAIEEYERQSDRNAVIGAPFLQTERSVYH